MKWHLMLIACLTACLATARTWTDQQGRKVEAEVVRVNADRTVVLKTSNGKQFTVPFDTFIEKDVEHLETRLALPFDLHPVPWQEMNRLVGLPLWDDENAWDDPCSEVARRINLSKESATDFIENYRSYPLGKATLFNEPVFAITLYGETGRTESLSMVFLNQGDVPKDTDSKELEQQIEATGERMHVLIEQLLGKAERDSLGKDSLREKVWRWDWNGHAIMLSLQEGKYTAMRIMPVARADRGGRIDKLSDAELKKRMAACVERRDNGDVVVTNIPMINQGPKGYCAPATWERYLRYMDIPADMYLLALAANTGISGGTYSQDMLDATSNIIASNGRKLSTSTSPLTLEKVSRYIDQGTPIIWNLMSTPGFQRMVNDNTAKRNGKSIKQSGQSEDNTPGGHLCLITGYNRKTDELAISDSWGTRFNERWVPFPAIEEASVYNADLIDSAGNPIGETTAIKLPWSVIQW